MKKLIFILFSALSLTAVAQNKKIALLEPRAGEGSTAISGMEKAMVRGELRKAIVNHTGSEAFTRADIDQLMKEQDFQRTGNVSEADIHRMGEMSGADYLCISTLNKSEDEFYLEAYLINVETGAISNPASQYGELVNGKLGNMLPVCQALAQELLGTSAPIAQPVITTQSNKSVKPSSPASSATRPVPTAPANTSPIVTDADEYVDLGLPSGTLWKAQNEPCGLITHDKAMYMYGNNLPTKEQCEELINSCVWTWKGDGYNVMGPNNKTIFFAMGKGKKKSGYWTSTIGDDKEYLEYFSKFAIVHKDKMTAAEKQRIEASGGLFYVLLYTSESQIVQVSFPNQIFCVHLVR